MKGFLFDENLPSIRALPSTLSITHVTELGERLSDTEIWNYARQHELAIVTKDADFSQRVVLSEPPPWVIHLRIGNMRRRDFVELITSIWPQIESALPAHKLVNVYSDSIESIQ